MTLSPKQRQQLIQWIAALPQAQFDQLLFSLKPPAGTIASGQLEQGTRAGQLLTWAEGMLGPGIPEVLRLLRSTLEIVAPNKLEEFDETFPGLHPTKAEIEAELCPYQGLEAFTPETRQFFYGRQDTVDLLVQKLETFNFVPVIGPSGSGKSSVVRAGLVPSLETSGWRVLEPIKPRVTPMASLELAISTLFQRATDIKKAQRLLQQQGLPPILEMLAAAPTTARAKTLLVIDQFEEVFTLCAIESERSRFIDCITTVQTLENSPLAIVTTMRADFVEPWLDYGDLVQTIQNQAVWLGRLQGENLRQAIEQPAKDLGYRFGPGLLDFILQDVQEEKNCLPLLEFALTELWEQRNRQNKELSLTTYTTMQGLKGALNKRAEAVYNDDLTTDEERTWAKRLCLELVRIGPDVKDTRQPQPRENLLALAKTEDDREVIQEVIEALVEGRLLVTTKGDEVDLAHEALMIGWQRFAEWRQKDRDRRRLIQRVRDAEKEWNTKGQDEKYLLQGGLLAEVREQWETLDPNLAEATRQFYQHSDEQEKEQVAFLERALAESELREQALKVMNLTSARPMEAAATAIHSAGISDQKLKGRIIAPVQGSLYTVIDRIRECQRCQGHESYVRSVAFSPDGTTIVSGSDDRTIRLWDLEGNPIGQPFQGHEDSVRSVAFSPDGTTIVSGSDDRTIRLWDLEGNPIGQPFQGHEDSVWSVAFSPDGTTIVSGSADRTIRLWDLEGNPIGQPFQGHESSVWSVAFSPDGTTIVSGSDDRTIRLWDLEGNPIGQPFQGHESSVWSVAFSPDGTTIVSGSADRTIRLWDLEGNPIGQPFQGHESSVLSVAFSPDGTTIVSGSSDRTIRLWDLEGNPIGQPFQGHESSVWSVAFSPDGTTIVSGSDDRTIRLWDLEGNPIGQPFQGHESSVLSVAFSPDGTTIVSGSSDRTIRLWDLEGNPIGQPFQGHESSVWSVAFSPDGTTIVSGSADRTIRLWDLEGNPIGQPFQGHEDSVWSVAFSPDGTTIVSGSC
jgi:WD40 repeat protein/energy-coupling factor transporter ATP-binding protein EcfA2